MKEFSLPSSRLIIAADFKADQISEHVLASTVVESKIMELAHQLLGLKVFIKLNSGLRATGYDVIEHLHLSGLGVFADLKLSDIKETLSTDGEILRHYKPFFVTAMCSAGPSALTALQEQLPETQVVGVTVLTSLTEEDCRSIHGSNIRTTVLRLIDLTVNKTPVRSFVCSPAEATIVREKFGRDITLITPAIRPNWTVVEGDDQNQSRVMTPAKAISAGSDFLVVGRPILNASDRRVAAERTIEEITSVHQ